MFSVLFTRCVKALHFTVLLYVVFSKFIVKMYRNGVHLPLSNIYNRAFLQKLLTTKNREIFLQKSSITDVSEGSKLPVHRFFLFIAHFKHIQDIHLVCLLFTLHTFCFLYLLGQVY